MGKPRNFDKCWFIDQLSEEKAFGYRETGGHWKYEKWFPLVPGTIKVFPSALVLITKADGYHFEGIPLTVVAVYEEREI